MGTTSKSLSVAILGVCFALVAGAAAGPAIATGILHPQRRSLTGAQKQAANATFRTVNSHAEDFNVTASDGTPLRGWKVHPATSNGDWVALYHGVADNRYGVLSYAEMLLRNGYSVVMMDARAHGESGGPTATYGWKERDDSRVIDDALFASEHVRNLFYLGESMGGATALQSAAADSRVAGVVAEASFANLREVAYDYAGLEISPYIGKTIFRPFVVASISTLEKEGGFKSDNVSPEKAVASRAFPIFLVCDQKDRRIPCRHSEQIYNRASGPKELWIVPDAGHTMAYGTHPEEFEHRVTAFFSQIADYDKSNR